MVVSFKPGIHQSFCFSAQAFASENRLWAHMSMSSSFVLIAQFGSDF